MLCKQLYFECNILWLKILKLTTVLEHVSHATTDNADRLESGEWHFLLQCNGLKYLCKFLFIFQIVKNKLFLWKFHYFMSRCKPTCCVDECGVVQLAVRVLPRSWSFKAKYFGYHWAIINNDKWHAQQIMIHSWVNGHFTKMSSVHGVPAYCCFHGQNINSDDASDNKNNRNNSNLQKLLIMLCPDSVILIL